MTPITETHHRHLSSARFFAVSYPSHMLLIGCSLFLPLVRFPVILPSRTSRNNTSWRRTCPSHLRFRCSIVLVIQRFSLTRFRTSELLTFAVQLIFSIVAVQYSNSSIAELHAANDAFGCRLLYLLNNFVSNYYSWSSGEKLVMTSIRTTII